MHMRVPAVSIPIIVLIAVLYNNANLKQHRVPAKSWNMRPCKSDAQAAKIQRERLFANSTAKCDDTGNSIVSYPSTRKKL